MRSSLAVLLALSAAACTAELTRAGREVRAVEPATVPRCTRLGAVEGAAGNGPSTAENERAATDRVRNQVARLGGNGYAITARDVNALRTVVRAEAYRCPGWEPVKGLAPR